MEFGVKMSDKILVSHNSWLNYMLINAGVQIPREKHGDLVFCLQGVSLSQTLSMEVQPGEFVPILNKSDNYWFTLSTIGCEPQNTYRNKEEIAALL